MELSVQQCTPELKRFIQELQRPRNDESFGRLDPR